VMTVLLAGEDTTANTLCWTLYLLHSNRAAWSELVGEIDAALEGAPMPQHFETTRTLDGIEHCVQEALRLRPVAPFMLMQNNVAVTIGGVSLAADTTVICLMRNAVQATDDAAFTPQRWRETSAGQTDGAARALQKASMPFGAGPRLCPGRYLAMLEMKMVLATIARNYELVRVATDDGAPPRERLTFTMAPVGLKMTVKLREHRG
jgi:cytochrome P450